MTYSPQTPHPGFVAARADFLDGSDTPRDFLERGLAILETRDGDVRAFVTTRLEAARVDADAATERYKGGRPLSLLDGCPLAVKDMIQTGDLPTQMGSPLFEGWQAPVDAACVHALRHAGAVVVGKTVTTEFAAGHTNETRNPHDLERTPGGSSSGSGAAVGAGMVPLALGTQTRGSVIRPAAFNGAVGFKPALDGIHMGGVHPLSPTLDHVGIIGAALADVWAAAHIMAGVPGGVSGHHALKGTQERTAKHTAKAACPPPLRRVERCRTCHAFGDERRVAENPRRRLRDRPPRRPHTVGVAAGQASADD